jgi:hypothetical protein
MCTVSYIPVRDHIYITTNRDEKISRKQALPPVMKIHGGKMLIYPVDPDTTGSWIVMKENGDAAVLLNGAFLCHYPEPPYRKSRGLVLLDLMIHERPALAFTKTDLQEIEPFTVILFEKKSLYEFRWDGMEKYYRQLTTRRPHIWSSSTLYDGLAIKKREQEFAAFLNRNPHPTQLDILRFHRRAGIGEMKNHPDPGLDLLFSTVSITGIHFTPDRGCMVYQDLRNKKNTETNIALDQRVIH